ncbi:MAG: hypothetical protein MZU97_03490 [Bacillus subtilis]|nr:hypothetical protein [Bacillus subtilis]
MLEETGYFNASPVHAFRRRAESKRSASNSSKIAERIDRTDSRRRRHHARGRRKRLTGTARGIRKATDQTRQNHRRVGQSQRPAHGQATPTSTENRSRPAIPASAFRFSSIRTAATFRVSRRGRLRYHGPLRDRRPKDDVFFVTETLAIAGRHRTRAGRQHVAGGGVRHRQRDAPATRSLIVQETEYTGAGKHHQAPARVRRGTRHRRPFRRPERPKFPGKSIVLPEAARSDSGRRHRFGSTYGSVT